MKKLATLVAAININGKSLIVLIIAWLQVKIKKNKVYGNNRRHERKCWFIKPATYNRQTEQNHKEERHKNSVFIPKFFELIISLEHLSHTTSN